MFSMGGVCVVEFVRMSSEIKKQKIRVKPERNVSRTSREKG